MAKLTDLLLALAGTDPRLKAILPVAQSLAGGAKSIFSGSQQQANEAPGSMKSAPFAKSDPITDPGGSTGGNDVDTGPNPGQNPYGNQFPDTGGLDYDQMFPDDQSLVDTYGWGTMGGGGGDSGGGGGLPLSWLDKMGIGAQIGGTVSEMLKPPHPPSQPGGGGLTKIDPVSLQFMIRQARGY